MNTKRTDYDSSKDFVPITCPIGSIDFQLFRFVVNQGIDSYLEAFSYSKFYKIPDTNRFMFKFHKMDFAVLIRRLSNIKPRTQEIQIRIQIWIADLEKEWNSN